MNGLILSDRFWSKVREDEHGCWLWTARVSDTGYGQWAAKGATRSAHRLAWMDLRGDIPDGLQIDHLCAVKPCVNPWHMELVNSRVNNERRWTGRAFCHLPPGTTAPWNRRETVQERQWREEIAARRAAIDARVAALPADATLREYLDALFGTTAWAVAS